MTSKRNRFRTLNRLFNYCFAQRTKQRKRTQKQQETFERLEVRQLLAADLGYEVIQTLEGQLEPPVARRSSSTVRTQATENSTPAPPTLTNLVPRQFVESADFSFTVTTEDPDSLRSQLTFALTEAPDGVTINPNTGLLQWSTTELDGGSVVTIGVQVTDDTGLTDTGSFQLTIDEVNTLPVIEEIANVNSLPVGETLSIQVVAADADRPEDTLTFALVGNPAGAVISDTGLITWTPTQAQLGRTVNFAVEVSDGNDGSAFEFFTVTPDAPAQAPVLTNLIDRTFVESGEFQFIVTADDPDSSRDQLQFELLRGPIGSTLNPTTGQFNYTTEESAGGNVFGIDVRVTDETGLSDTQTFLLTVDEVNTAPVFRNVFDRTLSNLSLIHI